MAVIKLAERPVSPLDEVALALPADLVPPDRAETAAALLRRCASSVGRLVLVGHPQFTVVGTAFMAGDGLAITAGHVADIFTERQGEAFAMRCAARIERGFGMESAPLEVQSVLRHPVLNVAVLRLGDPARQPLSLRLDGSPTDHLEGRPVAIVGVHEADATGRNPPNVLERFVGLERGSLVVAPGRVLGAQSAAEMSGTWLLTHDCTTLGGSAGAPLIDMASGDVLAIHVGGLFMERNFAVPASEIARDPRMSALGLDFTSVSVPPDERAFASAWPLQERQPTAAPAPSAAGKAGIEKQVDAALADRYSSLDEALDFIARRGEAYRSAVAAQAGRGRVDDDKFRRAIVARLVSRGLLDDAFLADLGLLAPAPQPATKRLSTETLEALKSVNFNLKMVEALLYGSPDAGILAPHGVIEPWPELVGRLNEGGAMERAALASLLGRLGAVRPESSQTAVSRALAELTGGAGERSQSREADESRTEGPAASPGFDLQAFPEPRPADMVAVGYLRRGAEAARSVCRITASAVDSRGGARGNGWLIAPDLVVTPAHLVGMARPGGSLPRLEDVDVGAFVVEFEEDGGGSPPVRAGVSAVASLDLRADLMILRLDRRLDDRHPLQLRTGPVPPGPITAIHHPQSGRKMLSYADARLLSDNEYSLDYLCATAPGSGGAPIFDSEWRVIATHLRRTVVSDDGQEPRAVKSGASVQALVDHIRGAPSGAILWRQVVGAQEALRSVDVSLRALAESETRTVMVGLVDESTRLPPIPGFDIATASGSVVTGVANRVAVDRLAGTLGVVSVAASRPAASAESVRSLPFIGIPLDRAGLDEDGDHAIVAVIDDGIDPFHETFLGETGKSRIALYWNQEDEGTAPTDPTKTNSDGTAALVARYELKGGRLYSGADLDDMAAAARSALREGVMHGTAVASIAAGRSVRPPNGNFCGGVAPAAQLIVVGRGRTGAGKGYESAHAEALDLIENHAVAMGLPVVVNISSGINAGAHDGTSDLERRCASFCAQRERVIVKSAGNEGGLDRHAAVSISTPNEAVLRWNSLPDELGTDGVPDQMELWFASQNAFQFQVIDPDRQASSIFDSDRELAELLPNSNYVVAQYETFAAGNSRSRVQIRIEPGKKRNVQPGEWKLVIAPTMFRRPDKMHAWLEDRPGRIVRFLNHPDAGYTITVPGTAEDVITVAAVEPGPGVRLYERNSRGPTLSDVKKPDLVAPGVSIQAARAGFSRDTAQAESGTSYAAPHVAGTVALALSCLAKARRDHPNFEHKLRAPHHLIRTLLIDTADDFNFEGSPESGFGRLNAAAFLSRIRKLVHTTINSA